jgi:hypothetical protein
MEEMGRREEMGGYLPEAFDPAPSPSAMEEASASPFIEIVQGWQGPDAAALLAASGSGRVACGSISLVC